MSFYINKINKKLNSNDKKVWRQQIHLFCEFQVREIDVVEDDPFELVDVMVGGGRVPHPATAARPHNRRVAGSPAQSGISQLRPGLARRP